MSSTPPWSLGLGRLVSDTVIWEERYAIVRLLSRRAQRACPRASPGLERLDSVGGSGWARGRIRLIEPPIPGTVTATILPIGRDQ